MVSYISVRILDIISNIFVLTIIVDSILTYFLSPFHPLRSALDRIVQPLLKPIRKVVPLVGNLDFSPLILIILVEIVDYLVGILIFSL
jgi:YggT family protein